MDPSGKKESENSLIKQEFNSARESFQNEIIKMEEEMSKFRKQLLTTELNSRSTTATPTNHFNDDILYKLDHQRKSLSPSSSASIAGSSLSSTQKNKSPASKRISTISLALEEGQQLSAEHQQKQEQIQQLIADIKSQERAYSPFYLQKQQHEQWWLDVNSPLICDDHVNGGKMLKLLFDVSSYEPEQISVRTIDNRLQVEGKREEKSENMSVYKEYHREFLLPSGINTDLIRSSLSADGLLTVEAPLPRSMLALE